MNWGNMNAISAGLTTIFFASTVTIYNDFGISPFMLTLVFPVMFSGQKKKSAKEALSFSLTHLDHKMELREKNQ